MTRKAHVFFLAAALSAAACAQRVEPVRTQAALGKVVIYRNGVAYFERRATPEDRELVLRVPAERVDDFLKSLTLRDAETGTPLPVSFPTVARHGNDVEMRIALPRTARAVRIAYVTESPAWKPSYRLELDRGARGRLEAWAVVDNVSGEDWNEVTVGVGSTSALSFRYDLHSVRMVERETLSGEAAVALAPPTGDSPYTVAGNEVQVLGRFDEGAVDGLAELQASRRGSIALGDGAAPVVEPQSAPVTLSDSRQTSKRRSSAFKSAPPPRSPKPSSGAAGAGAPQQAGAGMPPSGSSSTVVALAGRLRGTKQRVKVEGYAKPGEADAMKNSLSRAAALRDELVANGVPPGQIDTVGTGQPSADDLVRVVAASEAPKPAQAANQQAGAGEEPIGSAYFVAPTALTIKRDQSAMVSILNARTTAEQVYYYDPISPRGSKRYAFKAVRLENPSPYTLDQGPFTVYARGQFLGEGLSEPIPPKSVAFVPFAMDRQLIAEPEIEMREQIDRLVTIERGIVTTETRRIRKNRFSLHNRGPNDARVYVRHLVPQGWELMAKHPKLERLGGAYLFPVTVPAHGAIKLDIEEWTPITKSIDVGSEAGIKEIGLYLKAAQGLDPKLRAQLDEILALHGEMHDVKERIDTVHQQMQEYRTRVNEINVQLVTLRKVPSAQTLSRHLAQKMQEISDRLQKVTIEVTDLEARLMTQRIALQDKLAELSLEDPDAAKVARQ